MSGKGLSPASFTASPMTVQDADPLRFRVGEQDPKTREFAAFIGDQHRYFAAAAAAAAASANPHPHLEFHQNFYSEKPIGGNPNDSGGGSDDVDEEEEEDEEEDDDVDGNGGDGMNKDAGDDGGVSPGGGGAAIEQDNAAYYSQQFKAMEAGFVSSRHEESSSLVAAENGCDVSGRRDASSSSLSNSIESLRTILSDPITGALMSDAMILPCGHTFGAGGIEQVKQMKACCTCSQPVSDDSIAPNLTLRVAVQAFCREEKSQSNHSSKRKREGGFDQERRTFGDSTYTSRPRNRTNHFPFAVADRVIIKGNKRTPPRFVGREAVVTTQCLNGWYVVKTLDNAESVKLQYRSLAKATEDPSAKATPSKMVSNWL
ncbi:U-box domain-containing protein 62 [Hirschfeldia incana]|nr:U-box domain-containing protein 62 [Hirschfeldia incana]